MAFTEHMDVGFWHGLSKGMLMFLAVYLGGTGINVIADTTVVNPIGLGILALAFGVFGALGMSTKQHQKGE